MDAPVYQLPQVVQSRDGLEDFEGPLDLILSLLSKNKIEISDIPIALVLDQYLAYLARRKELDLEIASEFITMAAQLMFIKSRMLLSLEDEEAKNEMAELRRSLEERQSQEQFAKIKAVLEKLEARSEFGRNILTRNPEPLETGKVYVYRHTPQDLTAAAAELMDRGERRAPPPVSSFSAIARHEPYPVAAKASELLSRLRAWGEASFHQLFKGSRSRSEVVATFLAVLELCKNRLISLAGGPADSMVVPIREERPEDE